MKALLGMWGLSFLLLSCVPFPAWGTMGTLIITTDTILTEDHAGSIRINADNITLDCDGHTITGGGIGGGQVFIPRRGVTIANCHVRNGGGIGLLGSNGNTFRGNTVVGSSGFGFSVAIGCCAVFLENSAMGNSEDGFVVEEAGASFTGNRAEGNGWAGFHIHLSGGILKENIAIGNGLNGFHFAVFGGTVKENTAIGNGGGGFHFAPQGQNVTVTENTATDNNGSGFTLARVRGSTLTENTANDNNGSGFKLINQSTGNTLKENTACHNQDFDAFEDSESTGNVFKENDFCTTSGI